jgi:hypothetical protein
MCCIYSTPSGATIQGEGAEKSEASARILRCINAAAYTLVPRQEDLSGLLQKILPEERGGFIFMQPGGTLETAVVV